MMAVSRIPQRSSHGFTLVELLVAVGIIAALIAILLPVLGRARESGRRTECLSNLRQLGLAFSMYADANRSRLPCGAANGTPRSDDWIYWQPSRQLSDSAIIPYFDAAVNASAFRCPSDDISFRVRSYADGPYLYSYVMNHLMQEIKLTSIRNSSCKALLCEEAPETIDDGYGTLQPQPISINMLAIRHDSSRQNPDNPVTALTLNGGCRGNVVFCDGHGEYVDRNTLHSQATWDPNY